MNPKYELVDMSEEEKSNFMEKFHKFLAEESVYFEPVPQFTRTAIGAPWEIVMQVLLQKKINIEGEASIKEEGVPSPFTSDEPNKEN